MDACFLQTSQKHTLEIDNVFNKWCWPNWVAAYRTIQIYPYLSLNPKFNSKYIKDFNIRPDTLNLMEEKIGNRTLWPRKRFSGQNIASAGTEIHN